MLQIVNCIIYEHNIALVLLAAAVCCCGSFVTTHLLQKTFSIKSNTRFAWGMLGAVVAGSTIWCTHFVAMLAYEPGIPVTYDFGPTVASLITAILGCAAAFGIASERFRLAPEIGGAAFGISVTAMHYLGMAAFSANATIDWDLRYVIASLAAAIIIGMVAFNRIHNCSGSRIKVVGTGLLVLTIVSLHFTGMAALKITPLVALPGAIDTESARGVIALAVAGVGLLVLGTGAMSHFLDGQARSYASIRLNHLAESAVDGIAVVRNGEIVQANAEFARITQTLQDELPGQRMERFLENYVSFPEKTLCSTDVMTGTGSKMPIELTIRTESVTDEGEPRTVFALRDISQRLEHERRIAFLAQYDSLTGLRNRASFLETVNKILRSNASSKHYAIFAVDLNRFKDINDQHGHAAGDQVLSAAGDGLKKMLNSSQIAARIGGDEFVVFCPIHDRDEAIEMAERLEKLFNMSVEHHGALLQSGASIGVALYPHDGDEINTLLNNADLAMYRAKSSVNETVCLYNKSMDDKVRARRRLIEELRAAITNNELELHYQVQMRVDDEEIVGYEALVRWNHPERGMVPPNDFIPVAEQCGLIVKLGEWVLRTACSEAASWPNDVPVSVNLSPAQLTDPGFVECLQDVLMQTQLDPSRLELEVTETSFVADQARAIHTLEQVKAMGVSVSIDDFGTGYSSLAMLQAFPFDKIKIDKSLIDEIDINHKSKGVFNAVLSLGHALSVPILAEGVEKPEQLSYLRAQGCQLVQGYYYGKPQRALYPTPTLTLAKKDTFKSEVQSNRRVANES